MADIEVDYIVDLTDEEIQGRLFALGNLIAQEMRKLAINMGLVDTGDYSQGFLVSIRNGLLIIENRASYAKHLELGTFEFGLSFTKETFPPQPFPKKKDLPFKERDAFPRGMQPFAVMRRVLYNKTLIERLIKRVFA